LLIAKEKGVEPLKGDFKTMVSRLVDEFLVERGIGPGPHAHSATEIFLEFQNFLKTKEIPLQPDVRLFGKFLRLRLVYKLGPVGTIYLTNKPKAAK
jgi:hypothetical protein